MNSTEITFPRPCCSCGTIVKKRPTGALACKACGANWDSFLGNFGGAFMERQEADAMAEESTDEKAWRKGPRTHSYGSQPFPAHMRPPEEHGAKACGQMTL